MQEKPLITIITVVYNNKQGIAQTIESVLAQQYQPLEYIVIDGNSNDGTKEIIEKYVGRLSTFISEPDKGIYDAMNKGLGLATGQLVGIINSGDHFEPGCLEAVATAYQTDPEAGVYHGMLRVFNPQGQFQYVIGNHSSFLSTGMIQHPTCFVQNKVYQQHGQFSLQYRSSSDYDFMLRLQRAGVRFHFIEQIMANFYTGGISSKAIGPLEALEIQYHYGLISGLKKAVRKNIIKLKAAIKP